MDDYGLHLLFKSNVLVQPEITSLSSYKDRLSRENRNLCDSKPWPFDYMPNAQIAELRE